MVLGNGIRHLEIQSIGSTLQNILTCNRTCTISCLGFPLFEEGCASLLQKYSSNMQMAGIGLQEFLRLAGRMLKWSIYGFGLLQRARSKVCCLQYSLGKAWTCLTTNAQDSMITLFREQLDLLRSLW